MENNLEEYKQKLRDSQYYKDFYASIVEDFRNLMAISPEKAKEFATKIVTEKASLSVKGELVNYANDAEYEAKLQMDAQSLAILDIDFSRLVTMDKVANTTWQLNNIKAMLKNKETIVNPCQTTLGDFDEKSSQPKPTTQPVKFRTTKRFNELDREAQADKIRKYIIKDIAEQLYRINFELFKRTSAQTNIVFTSEAQNVENAKYKKNYGKLEKLLADKEVVSNILTIFGGLANSHTKAKATDAIVFVEATAKNTEEKLNGKPNKQEIAVLLANKMLSDMELVIENALTSIKADPEKFKDSKGMISFMNQWYHNCNDGKVIPTGCKKFGDSINNYTKDQIQKLCDYAEKYTTINYTDLQEDLCLE